MEKQNKKVVILGGGFAGVFTYLELLKDCEKKDCYDVTLINRNDYFDFIPLSHEIATGSLMPSDVTLSLHRLPKGKNTRFLQGDILKIDTKSKSVEVTIKDVSINRLEVLSYDYLLIALGSETDTFGVPGVKEHAMTLKGLFDAKIIKNKILQNFEIASQTNDEEKIRELLTFVVIGGGPTGVELSAEIADFVFDELYKVHPNLKGKAEVLLIHAGDQLIPVADVWFHKKSLSILKKLKVQVLLSKKVTEIRESEIIIQDESIKTRSVFWTAGVRARDIDIISKNAVSRDEKTGRKMESRTGRA